MKKIFLLLTIIATSISCVSQKKDNQEFSITEITLNAHTRGAMENISFIDNVITFKTYNTNKTNIINKEEINDITALIKKLNLKEIHNLVSPSDKRNSDGSLHATLMIKTKKTSYTSSEFDYDNPPKELKEIINLLQKLAK